MIVWAVVKCYDFLPPLFHCCRFGTFIYVCLSSVQDDIYALRKANNYALHPLCQKFAQWCVWCLWLTVVVCRPFKVDCQLLPFSMPLSSRCMVSLALFFTGNVSSSSHFRSSKVQATSNDCFACKSVCSVTSLDSSMSRTVDPQESWSWKLDVEHCHMPVWTFPFHFSLVVARYSWYSCHFSRQSSRQHACCFHTFP